MITILSSFADIILSFTVLLHEVRNDLTKTKISVALTDGSFIFLREIVMQNVLADYAYHWQTPDGALLIRWGNAAHYPSINTYPHHKHVGAENNVQPSYEQNLFQVFAFIKSELSTIS